MPVYVLFGISINHILLANDFMQFFVIKVLNYAICIHAFHAFMHTLHNRRKKFKNAH